MKLYDNISYKNKILKINILPLCNNKRTRLGVRTPCFMGKPYLSHPPIILKTYPLNSWKVTTQHTTTSYKLSQT